MNSLKENIILRSLKTEDGLPINNKRAVVDTISNRVLGIVSPRYKIIKNEDLLRKITPVVEELGMRSEPQITSTCNGAVTFIKFLSDKTTGEVAKGDVVQFGIEFFNSYNGSLSVGFHIIALRLVCANGLVVPKSVREIRIRHTGCAEVLSLRNYLMEYSGQIEKVMELWKTWTRIIPKREQLENFLGKLVGKRLGCDFIQRYESLPVEQQNLWQFYNILTYFLSHQMKPKKEEAVALRRFVKNETWTNRLTSVFVAKKTARLGGRDANTNFI